MSASSGGHVVPDYCVGDNGEACNSRHAGRWFNERFQNHNRRMKRIDFAYSHFGNPKQARRMLARKIRSALANSPATATKYGRTT